jgi:hypothetical protein
MRGIPVKIRNILFVLIIFILIVPIFQNKFNFVELLPLKGAITSSQKEHFSVKGWLSGDFQLKEEHFLNETFGFRSFFIRVNNQIAFSLFNKAKANGVLIGKQNYLYEESYIKAYFGMDFIGFDSTFHRIQRLAFIQDTLKKLNKSLILVFAVGKGSFYPEFFPEKYISKRSITNYENHIKQAQRAGLNYIDFNKYFLENKYKTKYPLFPQYGIHWSSYGMCLVADSIIRYIEKLRNIDMPNLYWNDVELSDPKESDYDIADGMNLEFKLKTFKMAYPRVLVQTDSGKIKPTIMVIADSYYWGIFGNGFTKAFSKNQFWFYNKQVYPNVLETSQIDLKDEILKQDVIIIMATEPTLPSLGWGFIERTYDLFK